jgi:hypothetical protein
MLLLSAIARQKEVVVTVAALPLNTTEGVAAGRADVEVGTTSATNPV